MEQPIIVTCALLILGLVSRVSGMAKAMDEQAELSEMPTIQNTTRCYNNYWSQKLCSGHTTIEITDAVYGVSPCNADLTHCCPKPGDCTIKVDLKDPHDHPDYYKEILRKCNNKKKCDNLQAQWINYISQWCIAVPDNTDYVTLYYMCLTEAERRTTTATATTDVSISASTATISTIKPSQGTPVIIVSTATGTVVSTATATVVSTATTDVISTATDVTDDGDDEAGDNSTQTIVIIAVVVAVVAAVVVAVTVWMVCRKRQANNTSQAPGMMTSHASACVDDVDPYHTARPGGGSGPQGPKLNPKAVDKPNIGADLYTEVVKVRPRKNVVLDKSPGEEDVEANNNGSDMTEAGDRASYDLVMQENHGYGTRQGVGLEGEGEWHGLDGEGLPHKGRQDGDRDEQTDPDYDLVMTENNAYS